MRAPAPSTNPGVVACGNPDLDLAGKMLLMDPATRAERFLKKEEAAFTTDTMDDLQTGSPIISERA